MTKPLTWLWSYHLQSYYPHNRGDCCQNQLKNSEVQILDSSGGVVAFQPITTGSAEYAFDFDGVSGTSVRIYSNSDGQSMNVAEVQVLHFL